MTDNLKNTVTELVEGYEATLEHFRLLQNYTDDHFARLNMLDSVIETLLFHIMDGKPIDIALVEEYRAWKEKYWKEQGSFAVANGRHIWPSLPKDE